MPELTNLERAITMAYESLRKARFDGDAKTIETLEARLDYLLDRVPRASKQGVN